MTLPILCSFSQQSRATDFSASLAEFMTGPCHNKHIFQEMNHKTHTVAYHDHYCHYYYYCHFMSATKYVRVFSINYTVINV